MEVPGKQNTHRNELYIIANKTRSIFYIKKKIVGLHFRRFFEVKKGKK